MPEPITTVTLGAIGAYLAKDGVAKLLGPTAEYLGDGLQHLVEKRAKNLARIFQVAEERLGGEIENPGQVPARILKAVINEGSYFDDKLAIEYYGGILASSRTSDPDEDRGVSVSKTLEALSIYQIRAHYIFYAGISKAYKGAALNLSTREGRETAYTEVPFDGFCAAMGLKQAPDEPELRSIMEHIMFGLSRLELIRSPFYYGTAEALSSKGFKLSEPAILVAPSIPGAELFLWGIGEGGAPPSHINQSDICENIDAKLYDVMDAKPFDLSTISDS